MVQPFSAGCVFDADDPRAPSTEQWKRMTEEERDRVVAMLPPHVPLAVQVAEARAMLVERREEARHRREAEQRRYEELQRELAEARAEIARLEAGR